MENIVFNLSCTVDCIIHKYMEEFKLKGEEFKAHMERFRSDIIEAEKHNASADIKISTISEALDKPGRRMDDIWRILKPFHYRVRELYPQYKELFDIYDD